MRITDIRTHRNVINVYFDSGDRLDMYFDSDDADSFAQCIKASTVDLCTFHPAPVVERIVCKNTLKDFLGPEPEVKLREQPWHGRQRWHPELD